MLAASALTVRVAIMTSGVRMLLAGTVIFGMFTGFVHLIKLPGHKPRVLYPAVFFVALFIVWAIMADRPVKVPLLRETYVKRLQKFEGTRYVWGGETTAGIDCSGLARSALWNAMLVEGAREVNPKLLGKNLWHFWWRDMSARDILKGRYGYTKVIGHAYKLAGYDNSNLNPGDMAVAQGIHVLVYVGKNRWIEANPDEKKVVIRTASAGSKRPYFNTPVTFVRWKMLQER